MPLRVVAGEVSDFVTLLDGKAQFQLRIWEIRLVISHYKTVFVIGFGFKYTAFVIGLSDSIGLLIFVFDFFSDTAFWIIFFDEAIRFSFCKFAFHFKNARWKVGSYTVHQQIVFVES